MFLYKQVPAERLSGLNGNHASRGVWGSALRAKSYKSDCGLNRFSLMGKPLLGLILITRIRASHGSCNHLDGLSPRKRKSVQSVIIGVNKSD